MFFSEGVCIQNSYLRPGHCCKDIGPSDQPNCCLQFCHRQERIMEPMLTLQLNIYTSSVSSWTAYAILHLPIEQYTIQYNLEIPNEASIIHRWRISEPVSVSAPELSAVLEFAPAPELVGSSHPHAACFLHLCLHSPKVPPWTFVTRRPVFPALECLTP